MDFDLTDEEKLTIIKTIRSEIEAKLYETKPEVYPETANLKQECGAFVTLTLNKKLRGCIGNIYGTGPLLKEIRELAVSSAFRDPRFLPLSKSEYKDVSIEVSVLSPLWKATSIDEIITGEHGVVLKYGSRSAVFLPQVATEQNWDRDTFLEHLCYKAGLDPVVLNYDETEFHLFTALIFKEEDLIY